MTEGSEVAKGQVLCEWNPHKIPILAEVGGKVRYDDVIEGETMRLEKDPSGNVGASSPIIAVLPSSDRRGDPNGKPLDVYFLPEKAVVDHSRR